MVRNHAAIKLSVAITVISRELRGRDQMPGGTEVPIDKTERGGALDPRNGGTSAAKLRQVKSGKRATSYSPRSGAFRIESA